MRRLTLESIHVDPAGKVAGAMFGGYEVRLSLDEHGQGVDATI